MEERKVERQVKLFRAKNGVNSAEAGKKEWRDGEKREREKETEKKRKRQGSRKLESTSIQVFVLQLSSLLTYLSLLWIQEVDSNERESRKYLLITEEESEKSKFSLMQWCCWFAGIFSWNAENERKLKKLNIQPRKLQTRNQDKKSFLLNSLKHSLLFSLSWTNTHARRGKRKS